MKNRSKNNDRTSLPPKVSVIVPVYNVEAYLDSCVTSILNQTLKDIEIILVDDGSPDRCPEMCDAYAELDSRVMVVHKQNEGLGYARNTGMKYAKGDWISFVDSDDCLALNMLEVCVGIGENYGVDQVRFLSTDFHDDVMFQSVDIRDYGKVCVMDDCHDKMLPLLDTIKAGTKIMTKGVSTNASAWGAIYRRVAMDKSGVIFPSERELISEDYAYNLEFAAKSGAIAYTSYPFYFYRVNLQSLSKMFRTDRFERSVKFSLYLRDKLNELGLPDAEAVAEGNLMGNLRSHLRHIYASGLSASGKREAHYEAVNHPYLKKIDAEGLSCRLPLLQRVAFRCRGSYVMSRILTNGRDWVKRYLKI